MFYLYRLHARARAEITVKATREGGETENGAPHTQSVIEASSLSFIEKKQCCLELYIFFLFLPFLWKCNGVTRKERVATFGSVRFGGGDDGCV